jgi:GNAT superfamily N-acetyltransferase
MIGAFLDDDVAPFLDLAGEEGWICDRWEFEFLLKRFPRGCLVWRERGEALAYITSIKYGTSGWIGNLLVRPEARRRGIGRGLMERSVAVLQEHGAATVWLTASESGAGLYRKLGFQAIDTICRWSGTGGAGGSLTPGPIDRESVRLIDLEGWGDCREALLEATCARGRLHTSAEGYICSQRWQNCMQIGPWGSSLASHAEGLLDRALAGAGEHVFLDVPAGNHQSVTLLSQRGFSIKGSNLLMYLGARPRYRPEKIYALASMGSMG